VNRFRLKACAKCQGDLVLDEGDWLCLQCGTYCYTGLYRKHGLTRWPQQAEAPPRLEKTLRLDQLAAGSLVGQEVSRPLAQRSELPLDANLTASMGFQFAVCDPMALNR
jgi:hypothetical protein